jgi:hypothetical protein
VISIPKEMLTELKWQINDQIILETEQQNPPYTTQQTLKAEKIK